VRLRVLLFRMDTYMSRHRDAQLSWVQIATAMGLDSTEGKSVTEIASSLGVTKQAVSKGVTAFLRLSGLPPAYGLKSSEARAIYRQTNHQWSD
jgi:hypothetical protein